MKKGFVVTIIFLIGIIFLFSACSGKKENSSRTKVQSDTELVSELKNPNMGEETLLPTIQIGHATGDILSKFEGSFSYHDNDNPGDWIVILTDIMLKELNFISINYDYESNSFVIDRTLFSRTEWQPDLAFRVNMYVSDGIPNRGISYIDGKNIKRYFYISESGVDGSLLLGEFIPVVRSVPVAANE
ncbi:MAG: hypothetical protein LBI28_01265 [Treponema sp.]|jgi:hypothetical protein|nr:hypothetical protein [Treponema sp.]